MGWLRRLGSRVFSRGLLLGLVIGGAVILAGLSAAVAAGAVNTRGTEKLAIHGYDAVAYFTEGKAVEGKAEISQDYEGAVYLFSSEANRSAFAADPEKYAPQYGGYCAYAVSKGSTADIDPEAWTVADGKLYLNYSKSVRATWKQDLEGNIARADANWPKLRGQ